MITPDHPVVLLVDDQLLTAEAVRRILAPHKDIAFHFCSKGADALATAARIQPTVILQDLVMPDADGLDLVRGYRQQEATALTPLIVLSSREEGVTKAEAFARGANDYIVKLPDPVELVARIRYHSRGYVSLLQRNQAFEDLRKSQEALAAELAKAAAYVRTLLPPPLADPVAIEWRFVPSTSLGGDCFDYFWLDDDHLVLYIIDICGHGVGPALLGVSVKNAIRSNSVAGADLRDPGAVLRHLNHAFPMESHDGMYFTMWYGVYRRSERTLSYTGGGHPPPLLSTAGAARTDGPLTQLGAPSLPIGIVPGEDYPTVQVDVPAGSELLLYSDGVIEVNCSTTGMLWGVGGLSAFVRAQAAATYLDDLHRLVTSMAGSPVLADDYSTILARFA